MSKFNLLSRVFKNHRRQLIIAYTLMGLELLGTFYRPYFLGEAVNDLLVGSFHGMTILIVQHLVWIIVGVLRHIYDSRTFSAVYVDFVTRMLSKKFTADDVSKLSSHSTLAREFVDFLEYDLYYVLAAFYDIIGAIIMLFFYDKIVVFICLAILIPVMLLSRLYGKKMEALNLGKNNELEKQVEIISTTDTEKIKKHYRDLRNWQIKISNQEAWNFGAMEFLVLIVITSSLFITSKTMGTAILAGDVLIIFNYLLKFTTGLDTIPYTIQRLSSLKDILRRIALEEEEI